MYHAAPMSYTQHELPNRLVEEPELTVTPDRGAYVVTIRTTNEGLAQAMEVMRVLLGVSDRMYRAVRNTQAQEEGSRRARLIRFQQDALAKLYLEYRSRGYKHRAAIAIVAESEIAIRLAATKSDIGVFIKVYQHQQKEGQHERELDGRGAARIPGGESVPATGHGQVDGRGLVDGTDMHSGVLV